MKCKKCGHSNLVIVDSGPHKKLICNDCLGFQKFLPKGQAKGFEQIQKKTLRPTNDIDGVHFKLDLILDYLGIKEVKNR